MNVVEAITLGMEVLRAILEEATKPSATRATVIERAQSVLDRARAIDHDVDDVAAGKS